MSSDISLMHDYSVRIDVDLENLVLWHLLAVNTLFRLDTMHHVLGQIWVADFRCCMQDANGFDVHAVHWVCLYNQRHAPPRFLLSISCDSMLSACLSVCICLFLFHGHRLGYCTTFCCYFDRYKRHQHRASGRYHLYR